MKQAGRKKPSKRKLSDDDKKRLWENHVGLVITVAKRYIHQCYTLELKDLIEEGWFGLKRAAELFDKSRGTRFSTYAGEWIRQSILRAIKEKDKTIRLPGNITLRMSKYKSAVKELRKKINCEPKIEEIAQEMSITINQAKEVERLIKKPLKFFAMDSLKTEENPNRELIIAEGKEDPWSKELTDKEELSVFLKKHLKPEEIDLIIWRFGLDGDDPMTYKQLGKKINRSHTTAEKRIENILQKLKIALEN